MHISHTWRTPRALIALMALEFLGTIAALTIYGIADNDTYRTALWRIGFEHHYCSNPDQILYAYANYLPLPTTPFIWSSVATQFNIVCVVFSMFVLLVKVVMWIMHMWWPALSVLVNAILAALWATACAATGGGDWSDKRYPMTVAWYLSKGCGAAKGTGEEGYCRQAQGGFAVAVLMVLLFAVNLALAIHSTIPTRAQRAQRKAELEEEARYMPSTGPGKVGSSEGLFHNALWWKDKQSKLSPMSSVSTYEPSQQAWEMQNVRGNGEMGFGGGGRQDYVPYTPRTAAFKTLDRQLPSRMEEERNARFR